MTPQPLSARVRFLNGKTIPSTVRFLFGLTDPYKKLDPTSVTWLYELTWPLSRHAEFDRNERAPIELAGLMNTSDKAANHRELRAVALELGFDLFGVADVDGMRGASCSSRGPGTFSGGPSRSASATLNAGGSAAYAIQVIPQFGSFDSPVPFTTKPNVTRLRMTAYTSHLNSI